MQASYGVDSNKGASNVANPYDFKNVHVSLKSILIYLFLSLAKTTTILLSKQRCRWVKSRYGYCHERHRSTKARNCNEIQRFSWFQKQTII